MMGTEKTVSALGNFPRATANGSCFPSRLSECTEQKEGGRATCGVWEKETGRCWNVAAAKPNCRRRKEARSIRFDSILRLPDWTQRHIVARPLGIDLSSHIKQLTHTHTHTHTLTRRVLVCNISSADNHNLTKNALNITSALSSSLHPIPSSWPLGPPYKRRIRNSSRHRM
jgi:hypothetical protein